MEPDRIPPVPVNHEIGRLDSPPLAGDLTRGRPEACASRRDLWNGWPFPPRRRLQPAAGHLTPVGSWMENHGWSDDGWFGVGWLENAWKTWEMGGKQEPRRLRKQAGFERKPMMDSNLELPAWVHGINALAKSARDRLWVASV